MKKFLTKTAMILLAMGLFMTACKKEKKPVTAPVVTTSAISAPLATSAMGGGTITSDGGAAITASGLCYSKSSQTPTVSNDTTITKVAGGSFTSLLKNLSPSSTYYVRAYATNSMGTGYGEVVTFSTGNGGPMALNVAIAGKVEVGETLTASYSYSDAENDAEDAPTFQWYRANDVNGTGEVAITGATMGSYKLLAVDEFKFIRVGVTVKAKTGTAIGMQVKSAATVAVATEPTTVTFTYNGKQVTYGILTSSVTGRKWMDRNLGAPNVPVAYDDYGNYGDLFQWGRGADGHQLVLRTGPTSSDITAVNGSIATLAVTDVPGHNSFIAPGSTLPRDWRSPQNDNLWQGPNGINNPCPAGWYVPSEEDWDAENLNALDVAFSRLKITSAGTARNQTGIFNGLSYYWSSTSITIAAGTNASVAYSFQLPALSNPKTNSIRGRGLVCRCIKK